MVYIRDKAPFTAFDFTGFARGGIVKFVEVPAFAGNVGDGVAPFGKKLPEIIRVINIARKAAADAYDSNRLLRTYGGVGNRVLLVHTR